MAKKGNILQTFLITSIGVIIGYFLLLPTEKQYQQVIEKLGYTKSILLIYLILFVLLYSTIHLWSIKYANICTQIYNCFKYPLYISYEHFIWKVSKNIKDQFIIHKIPICKKCKIVCKYTDFTYKCPKCYINIKTTSVNNLPDEAESLKNELEINGISYFKDKIVKIHNN